MTKFTKELRDSINSRINHLDMFNSYNPQIEEMADKNDVRNRDVNHHIDRFFCGDGPDEVHWVV